jgi:hypothetical protein
MSRLEDFKARTRARYPDRACDFSELDGADSSIRDAFERQDRVIFNYANDDSDPPATEKLARGYVGVTTGWKPVFIRVHNARSSGGGDVLSNPKIKVLAKSGKGKRRA